MRGRANRRQPDHLRRTLGVAIRWADLQGPSAGCDGVGAVRGLTWQLRGTMNQVDSDRRAATNIEGGAARGHRNGPNVEPRSEEHAAIQWSDTDLVPRRRSPVHRQEVRPHQDALETGIAVSDRAQLFSQFGLDVLLAESVNQIAGWGAG